MRRHFDGSPEDGAGKLGLGRMQRVLVERADGGDAQSARFGLSREVLGDRFPVRFLRNRVRVEAHPTHRPKTEPQRPI